MAYGIGWAVKQLYGDLRVRRAGWNGKGMWLVLVTKNWSGEIPALSQYPEVVHLPSDWQGYDPFVAMYTADKTLVPWLCSQTDLLATDWELAA